MTNPTAVYTLKGHKIREHQLFERNYYVEDKPHTATYFIDDSKAYYIDTDTGEIGRCNFNACFLNAGNTKSIHPLSKFYEGIISEN